MRALQHGALQHPKAPLGGNICRISTFAVLHPAFSTAQQVLGQLLAR